MTYAAAKSFIDKYFEVRPKLLKYIEAVREQAKTKGYVETLYGRRRPTPDALSANFAVREAAYRAAVNMPFQGTAADIMKMAMIEAMKLVEEKYGDRVKMVLQVHDELIFEVEDDEKLIKEFEEAVRDVMMNVVKLAVPVNVSASVAKNWGALK